MITNLQTAAELAEALSQLESTREALQNGEGPSLVDLANAYQAARAQALPVFSKAQNEYDDEGSPAPTPAPPGGEGQAPPPAEASPGVALVQPPGVVVAAETIERFGPLARYRSKIDPAQTVEATAFAFDNGTAVATGGDPAQVGVAQPSRIIRDGERLGVVTNDVFLGSYEALEDPAKEPSDVQVPPDTANHPEEAGGSPASASEEGAS